MIYLDVLGGLSLRRADGLDVRALLAQPKRLALLVYLALGRPGTFTRRDTLLALFWPDLDTERARQALRQSLYYLRRQLGADVLIARGPEDVAVNPGVLRCDATVFRAGVDAGRLREALAAYRGDLLPGFHVNEAAAELERWLEHQRTELRNAAAAGAWRLAEVSEAAGDAIGAAQWARRAADFTPGDEVVARRLIEMLMRLRDHAGALHAYTVLRTHLANEFGAEPAAATSALVAPLRRGKKLTPRPGSLPGTVVPADAVAAPPRRRRWRAAALAATVALALVAVIALTPAVRGAATEAPVVAVGWIEWRSGGDSAQAGALPDLLTTALSRVPRLQMITRGRLYDVKAQLGLRELDGSTLRDVARHAGATELVEGELYQTAGARVRLDLRRLALRDGRVIQAASEAGADLLEVVDRATATLAGGLGFAPPQWRLAAAGDSVVMARRFFDEGLRAFYRNDHAGARGLLQAALGADSTLAMAAYYLVMSEAALGAPVSRVNALWRHATRMADSAPDQERLYIKSVWANANMDPVARAFAETLVVRYPSLPDAHVQMGLALSVSGESGEAMRWFQQAYDMDSVGMTQERPRCVACDAMANLTSNYWELDSLAAAERVARRWVERAPLQTHAWWALFTALERQGRFDEARATLRHAGKALSPAEARLLEQLVAIRAGDFARAERALREISVGAEPRWRAEALWWLTVSLRMQGRFREALAVADQFRPVADSLYLEPGRPNPGHGVARAVTLLESGRGAEAASIFDTISRGPAGTTPTANARNRTWFLTHMASAQHAAGDTAALRSLVDRVAASGRESGFGRDRLLHHYVRGLWLAAHGALPEAAEEFRRNRLSHMYGWAVYRESEVLLALGRPREAIPQLRRVLRRSLETGNFYLNLTNVRELLGDAYAAAGVPDSAAQQYRWVAAAWRRADPSMTSRVAALRAKLAAAERHAAALDVGSP